VFGAYNMLLLLIIAGLGLFFSFIIHVLTMLNIFRPTDAIIITQNVIIGILLLALGLILKKMSRGLEKDVFNKYLLGSQFKGMEIAVFMAFILSLYGVIIFSIYSVKAFKVAWCPTGTVEMMHEAFYKSLSALLMTFYVIEFIVLYSFKVLMGSYTKRCHCGHANSLLATHCELCYVRTGIIFKIEKRELKMSGTLVDSSMKTKGTHLS
jgi:hypothetical protein